MPSINNIREMALSVDGQGSRCFIVAAYARLLPFLPALYRSPLRVSAALSSPFPSWGIFRLMRQRKYGSPVTT